MYNSYHEDDNLIGKIGIRIEVLNVLKFPLCLTLIAINVLSKRQLIGEIGPVSKAVDLCLTCSANNTISIFLRNKKWHSRLLGEKWYIGNVISYMLGKLGVKLIIIIYSTDEK